MPLVYWINLRWEPVPGAEKYEIAVDGQPVATAGARATTTRVAVQDATIIDVTDLPNRARVQSLEFSQETV